LVLDVGLRTPHRGRITFVVKKCYTRSWCGTDSLDVFLLSSGTGKKLEYNDTVHQLSIDFKKAYDSVRKEVLYIILIEFGVPLKLVRFINMCFNENI
jgi:hypothetical protein